ncbi:MAG: WG repeat-containing protein [Bacteroidota bacterium]
MRVLLIVITAFTVVAAYSQYDGHFFYEGKKTGLKTENDDSLIFPAIYKDINGNIFDNAEYAFLNDSILTVSNGKKYAVARYSGELMTEFKYDMAIPARDCPKALVQIGKKFGIVNGQGREIVPVIYDVPYDKDFYDYVTNLSEEAEGFDNIGTGVWSQYGLDNCVLWRIKPGFNVFQTDNKLGALNDSGKIITPFEFDEIIINRYQERFLIQVRKGDKWGFYYSDGELFCPVNCDEVVRVDVNNMVIYVKREGREDCIFSGK